VARVHFAYDNKSLITNLTKRGEFLKNGESDKVKELE
jgi:hypothetical protein